MAPVQTPLLVVILGSERLINTQNPAILAYMAVPSDQLDFRNRPPSEIEALFRERGFSKPKILNFKRAFREQQVTRVDELKGIRGLEGLAPLLPLAPLRAASTVTDPEGNQKFVFETRDGLFIESVLMPGKKSISLCISVQAGCRFGCRFCRTGKLGLRRSLLPHEMLDQIRLVYLSSVHPRRLDCVTFMGMGDPFDNICNCRIAFEWIRTEWGWSIGSKKITFSTAGAVGWDEFFAFPSLPNLAVSLHAADQETRNRLMPRCNTPLAELKNRMQHYAARANKQVSIEYCLFRGVNDSPEHARALAAYLQGLPCKINLMNYNPSGENDAFQPVGSESLLQFKSWMSEAGFPVLYRRSLGVDIGAGCGQLGESMGKPPRSRRGSAP
jgi:23S rRNA (adenine2503-C2)-methyltransferase